ncbi:serine hydrolase [uncultured Cytophaga sp.]|uniref:serine hydrolase domain-containing protein n=1 Tax=uncultured Cytophaga sp. TaxID=160238 RepID=UPI0026101C56|nr:serine hydrolase [uncultured Cytophaga sp.]
MRKKVFLVLGTFVLLVMLYLHSIDKDYYYKAVWYNLPGIFDENIFEVRTIAESEKIQPWPYSADFSKAHFSSELMDSLEKYKTTSVLFIQHDSIIREHYFGGINDTTRSNSFSVAKSYIGALVGRAIKLGYIKSVDQPVGDYIKEFDYGLKKHITIRHLLTMSSGLDWDEAYNSLFSQTTKAYYGSDLEKQVLGLNVIKTPGQFFEYKSCDTEIIAILLNRATKMSVSEFLEKELWMQMGSSKATWSLDHNDGLEKAFCCIYATAKDFARLGNLYLHKGNWNGTQLIDSSYIIQSTKRADLLDLKTNRPIDFYGYQWWVLNEYKGLSCYYMRGILGQNIIVIPSMNMVIVRMGHERGVKMNNHYSEMYALLDEAIRMEKIRNGG